MLPAFSNMKKSGTIMPAPAVITQSTLKQIAYGGGPSGSKGGAAVLKAGTLIHNPLDHSMNDHKRHSAMTNEHGNY